MAQGDVVLYNKFKERVGDGDINLSTAVMRVALTSDAQGAPPGGGATATDPRWGAGGTENLSTNEVSGGGYTAGGELIDGGDPWTLTGATVTYTGQNVTWTSAGSGDPTTIRWGVIYADDANDYAVGYVQMYDTADISLLAGDVTIKWNNGSTEGTVFDLT